jgi:uncharacterized membrane protein
MVANMSQWAAVFGGALAGRVLAHVAVPPVADIDVWEIPGTLFLIGQFLLIVLDVLFVVVVCQRIRLLFGESGLRPRAVEGLP